MSYETTDRAVRSSFPVRALANAAGLSIVVGLRIIAYIALIWALAVEALAAQDGRE